MRFVKMHGIGNDYIYIDAFTDSEVEAASDWPATARQISDRHTGVGADGLILVCRPSPNNEADVRMRMFNADGSESEMCGNGIRCVAKFAHDRLGVTSQPMRVETGRGVLEIECAIEDGRLVEATVDMGAPILDCPRIPVLVDELSWHRDHYCCIELNERGGDQGRHRGGERGGETQALIFTPVSTGNPHAVFFADENETIFQRGLRGLEIDRIGPRIEQHPAFPRRVNAHFVCVHSPTEVSMRTWERGSGETRACGTGACAVLVASALTGRTERDALIHLPGGDLRISWNERDGRIRKTGPATEVFEGDWMPEAAPVAAAQ